MKVDFKVTTLYNMNTFDDAIKKMLSFLEIFAQFLNVV